MSSNVYGSKGIALVKLAKYNEAIECFDLAIDAGCKDVAVYANHGEALFQTGRYEHARVL